MTGRVTDSALEHLVALLEHDVQVSLGRSYEPLIRRSATEHRMFFDQHAGEDESVLDQFFDRVVDDTQRYFQRFVDTCWPPCPDHPHHALCLMDDHWTCRQDNVAYGRLGGLVTRTAPVKPLVAPVNLERAFREFAQHAGTDLAAGPQVAVFALMLRFYSEVGVSGCDPADDEDMLLLDWGSYSGGGEQAYEIDLTREVTVPGGGIYQLHILYRFPNASALAGLPQGNDWWGSPGRIEQFEQVLKSNPALVAAAGSEPISREIYFESG